ncbi:MAG: ATP phosphoribosyltransferase regulatory subunit [Pseudomonadota bacterium]
MTEGQMLANGIEKRFQEAGAQPFETTFLQKAGTLLDLYGEDIRARAFTTADPLHGEMMLRPDFTVPLLLSHGTAADLPARFSYSGTVFRRQENETSRTSEYLQVGYERFDRTYVAEADAEVFALLHDVLAPHGLSASMGDIGLLRAAVDGLKTTEPRRAALRRHLWRPHRFRALLDRFASQAAPTKRRFPLEESDLVSAIERAGPAIGLRGTDDVLDRLSVLASEAEAAPLSGEEVGLIDELLSLRASPAVALGRLEDIAVNLPSVASAVSRFRARLEAIDGLGTDLGDAVFEASFGRTTLEYYDGFVFGFFASSRPDLPPVASGGRYDALAAALGYDVAAVGGIVRPAVLAEVAV